MRTIFSPLIAPFCAETPAGAGVSDRSLYVAVAALAVSAGLTVIDILLK